MNHALRQIDEAVARFDRATGADAEQSGDLLLGNVRAFIGRFCVFPTQHALTAVALWAAHAHAIEHFVSTPRLALLSPEPASGKTRVLEVLDLLAPAPMFSLSASPAAIFRKLQQEQITLLFDEVDAIWNRRGKDDNHEDLRALLNAGYKRGATIPRCVGPKHEVVDFPVFAAVALAGLGELPDTIMSRSVIIKMRRRAPSERAEPFRHREHSHAGFELRERLAKWARRVGPPAGAAWPTMPRGVVDRPAEIWEPLIAIADQAGGAWPLMARDACVALCADAEDRRLSLGIRLLADLRTLFKGQEVIGTQAILQRLADGADYGLDPDAPWGDIRGRPLTVRALSSMLKGYGVGPTKVKVAGSAVQGYRRDQLHDAWQRYLPSISSNPELPEPPEPALYSPAETVPDFRQPYTRSGTDPEPVSALPTASVPPVPQVPLVGTPESGCPRCAGEGCEWCA
ncbi:MAG: DUF3631 domain-containing protein [Steroidobacteraceae bacterium]